jgi:hypothetical protein
VSRLAFATAAFLLCAPVAVAAEFAPAVGKMAPPIKGLDLNGKSLKLSDYKGKVVLLDFWGNW